MSKTGGGPGSNQYGPKGRGKVAKESHSDLPKRKLALQETEEGQTPVDPDIAEFLTPEYRYIETHEELNDAEALGIRKARRWLRGQELTPQLVLEQGFQRDLHRQMFGHMWIWAGNNRVKGTIPGIDPHEIPQRWAELLDDARYWAESGTYDSHEICVRVHHRMCLIHPFTNGNGRHARLITDSLGEALGQGADRFTWGTRTGTDPDVVRTAYLSALRDADKGDYTAMLAIATT